MKKQKQIIITISRNIHVKQNTIQMGFQDATFWIMFYFSNCRLATDIAQFL